MNLFKLKYFAVVIFLLVFFCSKGVAEVYLTKDKALSLVLGKESKKIYEPQTITADLHKKLDKEDLLGDTEEKKAVFFFKGEKDGVVTGYALIDEEIGKHLPITYIVGITPDGKVSRVDIMVYREDYGQQVQSEQFLSQFSGKGSNESLAIGSGIQNIAGATYSTKSVSLGVRRALYLWNYFYGK